MSTDPAELVRLTPEVFVRRSSVIAITPQRHQDGTPLLNACTVAIEHIGILPLAISPRQAAARVRGEEQEAPSPLKMERP